MVLRFVANRCSIAEQYGATTNILYSETAHFSFDNLTSIQIGWTNWLANAENPGPGNVMSLQAEVEYPAGVYTPVMFSGVDTGVAAPLTTLWSDATAVSIPSNTWFKVHNAHSGSLGILTSRNPNNTLLGEKSIYPGVSLAAGRSTPGNTSFRFQPCAIIGQTSKRTIMAIGDSRTSGLADSFQEPGGGYGTIANALLTQYAGTLLPIWGARADQYLAGAGALQADLAQYATDLVNAYGINDFANGTNSATLLATQAAIRALYPSLRYHLGTIDPSTTSTDLWRTLANQTPFALDAQRQIYNATVLANAMGYDTPIDLARVSEEPTAPGKIKVDGTANKYTSDGTHQSPYCYALYATAGFTLGVDPIAYAKDLLIVGSSAQQRLQDVKRYLTLRGNARFR